MAQNDFEFQKVRAGAYGVSDDFKIYNRTPIMFESKPQNSYCFRSDDVISIQFNKITGRLRFEKLTGDQCKWQFFIQKIEQIDM